MQLPTLAEIKFVLGDIIAFPNIHSSVEESNSYFNNLWSRNSPHLVFNTPSGHPFFCDLFVPIIEGQNYMLGMSCANDETKYGCSPNIKGLTTSMEDRYTALLNCLKIGKEDAHLHQCFVAAPYFLRILENRLENNPTLADTIGTHEQRKQVVKAGYMALMMAILTPLFSCDMDYLLEVFNTVGDMIFEKEYTNHKVKKLCVRMYIHSEEIHNAVSSLGHSNLNFNTHYPKFEAGDNYIHEKLAPFVTINPNVTEAQKNYRDLAYLVEWCVEENTCTTEFPLNRSDLKVSPEKILNVTASLAYWFAIFEEELIEM
jgi:hypothetical protein